MERIDKIILKKPKKAGTEEKTPIEFKKPNESKKLFIICSFVDGDENCCHGRSSCC